VVEIETDTETKMAVLIESIRSLSAITANHDILLTKLIDDHETRIRMLEKCSHALEKVEKLETIVHDIEIHGSEEAREAVRVCELLGSRLSVIEHIVSNKAAVVSWWDRTWVRIGIVVGVALGLFGFIIDVCHLFGM